MAAAEVSSSTRPVSPLLKGEDVAESRPKVSPLKTKGVGSSRRRSKGGNNNNNNNNGTSSSSASSSGKKSSKESSSSSSLSSKEKVSAAAASSSSQIENQSSHQGELRGGPEEEATKFDCSSAIAQIFDGLWVSAVSGTRMGASLEAALLEQGVTAVVSTLGDKSFRSETFEHHSVENGASASCLRPLHDACDFINDSLSEGGVVFIHSRAGFSRSDWAVLVVLGYMIKYQNSKLTHAMDSLSETTKHHVAPRGKFRKDLVTFEEEALGDTSVDDDWINGDNAEELSKNHSLSRRKLAENLNDRRLLKKKSPHK